MAKSLNIPFIRTPYNYDRDAASDDCALTCPEPSLTVQEFTVDCDPTVIIERVKRGLDVSLSLTEREPRYGDFTDLPESRHDAMNRIAHANSQFYALPDDIRLKFGNNPRAFREFVHNSDNFDECVKLGLLEAKPVEPLAPAPAPAPAGGVTEGE